MSTVIVGGGIIGVATAFYLSESREDNGSEIHIVESSAEPFLSASGFAGGFLAEDWFSPAIIPLGKLSFDLHQQLANQYNGSKAWGYSRTTGVSLTERSNSGEPSERGDEWLFSGTSRAQVSSSTADKDSDSKLQDTKRGYPAWLQLSGGSFDALGPPGSCAQVDPRRLCEFLLKKCQEKGVKLHTGTSVAKVNHANGSIESVNLSRTSSSDNEITRQDQTQTTFTLPCKKLILAAGAWTETVFNHLFPEADARFSIGSLAGYSVTVRSPNWTNEHLSGEWHTVFSSTTGDAGDEDDFSPELCARSAGPSGEAEIYIAGLNDANLPVPSVATGSTPTSKLLEPLIKRAKAMLAFSDAANGTKGSTKESQNGISTSNNEAAAADVIHSAQDALSSPDLDIIRAGLCWRPITSRGYAIIDRVPTEKLGKGFLNGGKEASGENEGVVEGGLWIAAGHGPWGISLSLGTGKVLSEMIRRVETSCDVSALGYQF